MLVIDLFEESRKTHLFYQFHISFGVQHEVFWLQVSIQDAFVMEVCKGFNHTGCYKHSYIFLKASSATWQHIRPHSHIQTALIRNCVISFKWTLSNIRETLEADSKVYHIIQAKWARKMILMCCGYSPRCCYALFQMWVVFNALCCCYVFLLVYMQYRNRTKVGLICFPHQTPQTHEYLTLLLVWSRFPHQGKTPWSYRCSENLWRQHAAWTRGEKSNRRLYSYTEMIQPTHIANQVNWLNVQTFSCL